MEFTSNTIEENFDDFLDEQYVVKEGQAITADTANYYLGRIKSNNESKEAFEATAKELKAKYAEKVELWLAKQKQTLDNDNTHCLSILEQYFHQTQSNPDKKIKLPNGNIGFYKTRDSIQFSDNILEYISNNDKLKQYIVPKYSVDTKALRSDSVINEVTDEKGNKSVQLKIGDVVLPVDMVTVKLGTKIFNFK